MAFHTNFQKQEGIDSANENLNYMVPQPYASAGYSIDKNLYCFDCGASKLHPITILQPPL